MDENGKEKCDCLDFYCLCFIYGKLKVVNACNLSKAIHSCFFNISFYKVFSVEIQIHFVLQ